MSLGWLRVVLLPALAAAADAPVLVAARPELPVVSAVPVAAETEPLPLAPARVRTLWFPTGSAAIPWYTVRLDLWDSEGGPTHDRERRDRAWSRVQCPAPAVEAHLAVYDLIDMSFSAESLGPDGSHSSWSEMQLVVANPGDFPVEPQARTPLYSFREGQLPRGAHDAFAGGGLYVLCLGQSPAPAEGEARAALSATWSEVLAVIAVERTQELRYAVASPLYRPSRDAIARLVLVPSSVNAVEVRRGEDAGIVVVHPDGAPVPCDPDLGARIAYALAELPWTPSQAGPRMPRLGPRYALDLVNPQGSRTLSLFEEKEVWIARGPDGRWYRAPAPRAVMGSLMDALFACRAREGR